MAVPTLKELPRPPYNQGPRRQPQHDSYGRKVPIWEASELQLDEGRNASIIKQPSWRSWLARKDSSSSSSTVFSDGCNISEKPSRTGSWKSWMGKASPWSTSNLPANDPSNPSPSTSPPTDTSFERRYWRPYTLRLHILGSVFLVTLGMIAALELLYHISARRGNENGGGLAFAATADELSTVAVACYIYLPTAIAVIYSIIWGWVDLDVKRLEPWFQLSKPEGATAEDSVLLAYPFDFLAFVPLRAARRRHWAVFIAGSAMMLITWAIVPLQSAIFTTGMVTRTRQVSMTIIKELMPAELQPNALNTRFMITAYGMSWLGQEPPPYTTKEYALLPFSPSEPSPVTFSSESWTASTWMYYTNLTCSPVAVNKSSDTDTDQPWGHFLDSDGCIAKASDRLDFINLHKLLSYTPWCDDKFLAIWGEADPNRTYGSNSMEWENLTALSCRPSYHRRPVTAVVNASTSAVISILVNETSTASLLNEDAYLFNTTLFETLAINAGQYSATQAGLAPLRRGDVLDSASVQQSQKFTTFNVTRPTTRAVFSARSIAPYALAASLLGFEGLSDPPQMQAAFQEAHQILFSAAASHLMVPVGNLDASEAPMKGLRQDSPEAVILVRGFGIAVEACLGVVCLLICALWLYSRKRPSHMTSDPRAVADVMKLVRSSQHLLHGFRNFGTVTVTTKDLENSLKGRHFSLSTDAVHGMQLQVMEGNSFDIDAKNAASTGQNRADGSECFEALRPFELKYITGIVLGVVIAAATALLISLYVATLRNDGLARPSNNTFVLLLLTNLIPTAFATLMEPFWVMLNRLLCILQPFEDLRDGAAKSSSTIKAKYTSLPPQLPVIHAIRSRHYLLALVCIVSLTWNILAVGLSGLFNEEPAVIQRQSSSTATLTPGFNDPGGIQFPFESDLTVWQSLDQFYIASAYLEGTASLIPWVDSKYYYIPVDLPENFTPASGEDNIGVKGYSAQTRGYGVEVDCQPILEDSSNEFVIFKTTQNGTRNQLNVVKTLDGGGNMTCSSLMTSDDIYFFPLNSNWSDNATAIEWMYSMYNHLDLENMAAHEYCAGILLAGYVRIDGRPAKAALAANESLIDHMSSAFMMCKPVVKTGMFDIDFDITGRVQSSRLSGNLSTNIAEFGSNLTDLRLRRTAAVIAAPMQAPASATWHNDSFTHDWMNTLLGIKLNTSDLVNPAKPLPNVTDLAPHLAQMYELLFPITLALTAEFTFNSSAPRVIPITVISREQRIFMEPAMFYITISLLGLQLFAAVLYYALRPRCFLPRLPLSIASIISYVSASHAVRDSNGLEDERYGYGHYIGIDGKTHVGIEKSDLVVPLKATNPEVKRRRRALWLRREGDPRQPKVWI